MKIKMTKTAAGPRGVMLAGHEYTVEPAEGARLCQAGAANPVSQVAEREIATMPPLETRELEEKPFNTVTHEFNVRDCVDLVSDVKDAEELERLHAGERMHPDYPGGRKTVLDAIEERLGELGVEH